VKHGLPRVLGIYDDLVKVRTLHGVPVFAMPPVSRPMLVVYVPVNPFCEFQPYQAEIDHGPVRG
jgi:hypothetical protein